MFEISPSKQTVMVLLLLAAALVIIRSLLHKSSDQTSAINLDDLILETDLVTGRQRMSIIRVLALGAFVFTIWMMVFLTLSGKMTEGYFTIFNAAWVAPLVTQIIWGKKPPPSGPTTVITGGDTTVKNP